MEDTTYNFTVIVRKYERNNPTLDDMRAIYSARTCLVAKNSKYGDIYLHPCAKIVKGRFEFSAGSHSYPVLMPKTKEVHIQVRDFPYPPDINTDQYNEQEGIIEVIEEDEMVS